MTATPQAAQRPDTNEMKVIHRVFRREFTALPALVRGVRDGDTERSAVVGAHLQQMLWFLRIHHEGEDELLWPLLLDRATLQADLVHRMESQHQVVAALIGKATALLPEWTATASAAAGDSLATLLGELTAPLFEHLGEEEQHILPLAADHLSVAEWAALGQHGRSHLATPQDQVRVLGAILEDATPDERARMLAPMPPPARDAWTTQGAPAYAAYIAQVRQG